MEIELSIQGIRTATLPDRKWPYWKQTNVLTHSAYMHIRTMDISNGSYIGVSGVRMKQIQNATTATDLYETHTLPIHTMYRCVLYVPVSLFTICICFIYFWHRIPPTLLKDVLNIIILTSNDDCVNVCVHLPRNFSQTLK